MLPVIQSRAMQEMLKSAMKVTSPEGPLILIFPIVLDDMKPQTISFFLISKSNSGLMSLVSSPKS